MKQTPSIDETIDFIEVAFDGETNRSGFPTYQHSVDMMNILPKEVETDIKLAALLHDVVEDTHITLDDLRKEGYSELTCKIVETLSHDTKKTPYFKYVKQIIEKGLLTDRKIEGAILVKYADTYHNTLPKNNVRLPEKMQDRLSKKYEIPKQLLRNAILALGYEDYDPNRQTSMSR